MQIRKVSKKVLKTAEEVLSETKEIKDKLFFRFSQRKMDSKSS